MYETFIATEMLKHIKYIQITTDYIQNIFKLWNGDSSVLFLS